MFAYEPGPDGDLKKSERERLHRNGIEVILDVVYNHTAEGNHLGPTISFKGIDNSTYYRLDDNRRYYFDVFSWLTTGSRSAIS